MCMFCLNVLKGTASVLGVWESRREHHLALTLQELQILKATM